MKLTKTELITYLKTDDVNILHELFFEADRLRKKYVGDEIHLRGLVEFSNICTRSCLYCGISRKNTNLQRYLMKPEEILETTQKIVDAGFGTIVLQSGEGALLPEKITGLIKKIKEKFNLAITLSLGEFGFEILKEWKEAGANRYLLRFETGIPGLFERIHPGSPLSRRLKILNDLKELGYEAGTGIMIGIPGQTYESIAEDLLLMKKMDIDMVGLGPYIPHPDTELGKEFFAGNNLLVPNTQAMTLKVLALARILMPDINIPSTTALATLSEEGRTSGLNAGANVVMPNMTPAQYRKCYEIYPKKNAEFSFDTPEETREKISKYLKTINRIFGRGKGNRKQIT
ncbi:MAG: [FeFe] hydrogenase H-cluster radical SAM maturase HydE [Vulcanimicrobiota bacterium]